MPSPTKDWKNKGRGGGTGGGRGGRGGGGGGKRGGFTVGPRLAKGSYKGHTDKIKRTLIHKASVKRQYYKDLKAEGYGDAGGSGASDMATGSNGGALGPRKGVKKPKKILGEQRRGPVESSDEEGDDDGSEGEGGSDQSGDEEEQEEPGNQSDSDSDSDDDDGSSRRSQKSKQGGRQRSKSAPRSQPAQRIPPTPKPSIVTPAQPAKRARLTDAEVEKLREDKRKERREWGQRGQRGQPKLGNRVEQLLGKIKKNMGQ